MVTNILEEIKKHFGDLTITRGKKHVFLGMNLEITKEKELLVDMSDQLRETVDIFPDL